MLWIRNLWLGLSLERKLPLLVSGLLLGVVLLLSVAAYEEIRRASRVAATTRLERAATDLADVFQRSAAPRMAEARALAANPAIAALLQASGRTDRPAALQALRRVAGENAVNIAVELQDGAGQVLLRSGDRVLRADPPLAAVHDSGQIGPLRVASDTILYHDIRAAIRVGGRPVGQVVLLRRSVLSTQGRQMFTQLIGRDVALLLGNTDGPPWTDLAAIVPPPPDSVRASRTAVEYERDGARLGASAPIAGTPWLVLVELPLTHVYAAANTHIRRMAVVLVAVVLLGGFGAQWLGRRVSRPLIRLTAAAEAMAAGDLSQHVEDAGRDEPGRLAAAFNVMAGHVALAQKGLEAQVAERTAELERANKELEAFTYSVSHDLRAPLRAIHGFAHILIEDHAAALAAEPRRLLGVIDETTRRMGRLIDDLLAFSRLGRQEVAATRVDMTELAQSVAAEIRDTETDGAAIAVRPLPAAHGDRALLRQVLVNLLQNAVKFTRGRPGPRIEVGAGPDGNGGQMYFVRDNGVGFDMRYVGKLFGVFQRLHAEAEFPGSGVGLATVQRIIHRHGGRVWADGKVGEGATFCFTLPASGAL